MSITSVIGFILGIPAVGDDSAEPVVDYYIATNGSDANDGSSDAPWASFAPLITAANALADSGTLTAFVREGTYVSKNLTIGASVNTGCEVTITIADGTVFQGTSGVDASWLNVTGGAWTLNILGQTPSLVPTWTVQDYDTGTGNGIGMDSSAGATLVCRQVLSQGNVDGWSCHGTNPQCYVYDSVFKSCSKSAASHVHTAGTMYASNCEFWGNSPTSTLGIYYETILAASANTLLEDCKFVPTGTGSTERNCDFLNATLRRCRLGTLTLPLVMAGSTGITVIEDSYLNANWDMNRPADLLRCYGRLNIRQRNNAVGSSIDKCVFVGASSGAAAAAMGLFWRNFDPTSAANMTVTDTVLRGYTTAIGMSYGAGDATYWANSGSTVTNACMFGNTTNVDADIVSADPGSITGTVTSDPQMPGTFDTYVQADYVVGDAGPCVGAGVGGTNIGFTLADITP